MHRFLFAILIPVAVCLIVGCAPAGIAEHDEAAQIQAEVPELVRADGTYPTRELEKDTVVVKVVQNGVKNLQDFPTVAEALRYQAALHEAMIANLQAMDEADLVSKGPAGRWPRLCDIFFRAIWHAGAHIRQIWFLRGVMGVRTGWPVQHYA